MIPMAGNAATAAKLGAKYGDAAVGAAKALDTVACPNSFRADTPVATASGPQPISTLTVGDTVLAWDATTGQTASYTITATISHIDAEIVHLTIAGERLETTREHPFFVAGIGWVPAEDLQIGAAIWRYDRQVGQVEYLAVEARTQRMYNLTVATAHTFFVGDGQWLVHNCGGLDDLAARRQLLDIPAAGTPAGEKATLARLDIGGANFYGRNGSGAAHPGLPAGNTRSTGHAEWDAFGAASEAFPNGVGGGKATLYVDREPCRGGCRSNFGTWARHLGLDELDVISRNGYRGSWDSGTNKYRTAK